MKDQVLSQFTPETEKEQNICDRKLRIGIIGTGGIANAHVQAYLPMEDAEIVAGADIIPGKAEAFFEKFGVDAKCYSSHKEMLDDESLKLDAVSICTYNRTHAECAIYDRCR